MLSVSRTYLEMPVVVHEFTTQARLGVFFFLHGCCWAGLGSAGCVGLQGSYWEALAPLGT